MKRYRFFHIPPLAFFAKDLYRDVALNWKGTCLGYLLLLLIVCWVPRTMKVNSTLSNFIDAEAPKFVFQVPIITIKDGIASTDVPQPHYIYEPDSGDVLAIIDTTGQITSLEGTDAIVLLTESTVFFEKNEFETRTFDLSKVKEFTLEQSTINHWLNVAKKFLAPAYYVMALVGSYLFRIVQVLIYAAIGMLFVSSLNANLPYIAVLRLAVVAVTPCIIVKTVLRAAGISLPLAGLAYLVAALAYLYFGVKASSQPQQAPLEEDDAEDDGGPEHQSWRGR